MVPVHGNFPLGPTRAGEVLGDDRHFAAEGLTALVSGEALPLGSALLSAHLAAVPSLVADAVEPGLEEVPGQLGPGGHPCSRAGCRLEVVVAAPPRGNGDERLPSSVVVLEEVPQLDGLLLRVEPVLEVLGFCGAAGSRAVEALGAAHLEQEVRAPWDQEQL